MFTFPIGLLQVQETGGGVDFPGLIHYYKLTQTSGTYVDSHGTEDLTIVGSGGGLTRTSEGAVFNDSSAHYLDGPRLDFASGTYYLSAWFRVDNILNAGYWISETDFSSYTGWRFYTSSQLLGFSYGDGSSFISLNSGFSAEDSSLYFFEMYRNNTDSSVGYCLSPASGSLQAFQSGSPSLLSAPSGINLTIGNRSGTTSAGNQVGGRISEIAIASTLPSDLTTGSTFRNALFNGGLPLTYEDLSPS